LGGKRCSEREIEQTIDQRVELKREKRIAATEIEREKKNKTKEKNKTTERQGYWADWERLSRVASL